MIRIAAVAVLALTAYKCTSQTDFRINTAVGLVVFCESSDPDEICLSFGVVSGEIKDQADQDAAAETVNGVEIVHDRVPCLSVLTVQLAWWIGG